MAEIGDYSGKEVKTHRIFVHCDDLQYILHFTFYSRQFRFLENLGKDRNWSKKLDLQPCWLSDSESPKYEAYTPIKLQN